MTMSPSLRAATSQTSIVRMVLPMPHRLRLAGRHAPGWSREVSSGAGGIAAGDADQAAARRKSRAAVNIGAGSLRAG